MVQQKEMMKKERGQLTVRGTKQTLPKSQLKSYERNPKIMQTRKRNRSDVKKQEFGNVRQQQLGRD